MIAPKIRAEFVVVDGKPKGRSTGNYEIRLCVEGAPPDTHAVTYRLDPSYYDPIRESRDRRSNFGEEITSYGDYPVHAKVRTSDHAIVTSRNLYDALRETYGDSADPDIQQALEAIRDN
jgi:hypothetical protein